MVANKQQHSPQFQTSNNFEAHLTLSASKSGFVFGNWQSCSELAEKAKEKRKTIKMKNFSILFFRSETRTLDEKIIYLYTYFCI